MFVKLSLYLFHRVTERAGMLPFACIYLLFCHCFSEAVFFLLSWFYLPVLVGVCVRSVLGFRFSGFSHVCIFLYVGYFSEFFTTEDCCVSVGAQPSREVHVTASSLCCCDYGCYNHQGAIG